MSGTALNGIGGGQNLAPAINPQNANQPGQNPPVNNNNGGQVAPGLAGIGAGNAVIIAPPVPVVVDANINQPNVPPPAGELMSAEQFLIFIDLDLEAVLDEPQRERSEDEIRFTQQLRAGRTEFNPSDHLPPSYLGLTNIYSQNFRAYWSDVAALAPVPPQLEQGVTHRLTVPLTDKLTEAGMENLRMVMSVMEIDPGARAGIEAEYRPLIEMRMERAVEIYRDDLANAGLTTDSVDEYTDDFVQDVMRRLLEFLVAPMPQELRETPGLIASLRRSLEHSVIQALLNALPEMDQLSELQDMFPDATMDEIATQLDNFSYLTLDNIRVEAELLDQERAANGLAPYVTNGNDDRLGAIFSLAYLSHEGLGTLYNATFNLHARAPDPVIDNDSRPSMILPPDFGDGGRFSFDDNFSQAFAPGRGSFDFADGVSIYSRGTVETLDTDDADRNQV